ncbi:MAG: hypothetical protein JXR37_25430 [Kiritimatiellae bacterium]|nr:hypothetical protein [Kiritimatiellia bacterium]
MARSADYLQTAYAKWRRSLPDSYPHLSDYRRVLLKWVKGFEAYWEPDPDQPALGKCRTRMKQTPVNTARVLPVYAACAACGGPADPEWPAERFARRINAAIAYLCSGYDATRNPAMPNFQYRSESCPTGYWAIQPGPNQHRAEHWVIGNMLDVMQIAPDILTAENRRRIREILVDIVEAERTSGRAYSLTDYRHEGITWTMNLFARGAMFYPDHPLAQEWMDIAKHGFASSMSVEQDLQNERVLDGKPVKEWVARRCPVFYPDFTFSHHGLGIHPGYMCLGFHRTASLYELMKRRGLAISPVWYNRYRDTRNIIKGLALWDGRVAYPNGKDWADYVYGAASMLFHMVGLQMMFRDGEARRIEQGIFRQLEWLQLSRGEGNFSPPDAEYVFNTNDAKNLAFAWWVHENHGFARPMKPEKFDRRPTRVLHSPHSEFVCVRDPSRFASWGWHAMPVPYAPRGRGPTTGLIIPRGRGYGDHLAQWDDSLIPEYWTESDTGESRFLKAVSKSRQVETFKGGFAVSEQFDMHPAAADKKEILPAVVADQRVMVALPDGRTVLFFACGKALESVQGLSTTDMHYHFVRSVFSDMKRMVYHDAGQEECRHIRNKRTTWLNIDGMLGIVPVGMKARVSCTPYGEVDKKGNPPVNARDPFGMHAGQTVLLEVCSLRAKDYRAGQDVFGAGVGFVTDVTPAKTRQLAKVFREETPCEGVRLYRLRGQDGKEYVVAANVSDSDARIPAVAFKGARFLTRERAGETGGRGTTACVRLAARHCIVLAAK